MNNKSILNDQKTFLKRNAIIIILTAPIIPVALTNVIVYLVFLHNLEDIVWTGHGKSEGSLTSLKGLILLGISVILYSTLSVLTNKLLDKASKI